MKKILLLAALFTISFSAIAQIPDGSIAPDFTATDINGVEHNLYDLLDQGKSVVLDVSATWCPPCWTYHQGGVLESLWEEHGPDGADDMYVFMIEGDGNTTMADLQGNTTGTMGDWITGTNYPIIDDASIANAYQIGYFPTIFHICPNKVVTEIGQVGSVAAYANAHGACEQPSGINNGGVLSLQGFGGAVCGEANVFTPSITLQNMGTGMMTEATLELLLDGAVEQTKAWTGNLGTYQVETVAFDEVASETASVMTIRVADINGSADEAPANDLVEINIAAPLTEMEMLTVEILTDDYGNETYWEIQDAAGEMVASGGNAAVGLTTIDVGAGNPPADPGAYGSNETITVEVMAPADGCYTLIVTDYWGDGMCCAYGDGYYSMTDSEGTVLAEGGAFEGRIDNPFEKATPLSNEEVLLANTFDVFPNPVQGNLAVNFNLIESTKVNIQLVNALGQTVYLNEAGSLATGEHNVTINMDGYQAGLYFVNLVTEHGITTQRVIKQ